MAALTTIFTPPSSCFNNDYTAYNGDQSVLVKDTAVDSSQCYPTGFKSLFASSIPYSPGVCPAGYSAATSTVYHAGATAAICCPTSWTVYPSGLGCSSILTTSTVLSPPTGQITATSGVELRMHAFYVAWVSSDLAHFTPASAPLLGAMATAPPSSASGSSATTTGAIASGLATTTVLVTPSATVSSSTDSTQSAASQNKQGLSTGAQAGIGAGIGLAALLILAAAIWLFRQQRRKSRIAPVKLEGTNEAAREEYILGTVHEKHISELSSDGREELVLRPDHKRHISELSGDGRVTHSTAEADSVVMPAELDSGQTWDSSRTFSR